MAEQKSDEEKKLQEKNIKQVLINVNLHCEGCKNKVIKCLRGFSGVEEVTADDTNKKVMVNGKNLDPAKILERVRKKYGKNAELISPITKPNNKEKEKKPKIEEPQVKYTTLKMYIHCQGCADDIKKNIKKMTGVLTVETNMENSRVVVRGTAEASKIAECIRKRMGKNVEIMKEVGDAKGEKKKKKNDKKDCGEDEYVFKYPPQYSLLHLYPNQTFSDDNVFSCCIM